LIHHQLSVQIKATIKIKVTAFVVLDTQEAAANSQYVTM
jgi:hypothetical protein